MEKLDRNFFWIGGKHACLSALNNKERKIKKVLCTNDFIKKNKINTNENFNIVSTEIIKKCFKDKSFNHQGIAVLTNKISTFKINEINLDKDCVKNIIVLDGITDQRNLGSIIRSSLAFDVSFVIINKRFFNQDNSLFLKSASGAFEKQKIILTSNIKNDLKVLRKKNFWIYSLDLKSETFIDQIKLSKKNVFIFGSEGHGIKKTISNYVDTKVKIKINNNIESLNVSNAVTSLLTLIKYNTNI